MGLFDSLTDFAAEVITAPITLPLKIVAAVPEVAEKCVEKIEDAVN